MLVDIDSLSLSNGTTYHSMVIPLMQVEPNSRPPLSQPAQEQVIAPEGMDGSTNTVHEEEEVGDGFQTEDAYRRAQKVNSVACIADLRLKPHSISRLRIPLCRLAPMPMIKPAL